LQAGPDNSVTLFKQILEKAAPQRDLWITFFRVVENPGYKKKYVLLSNSYRMWITLLSLWITYSAGVGDFSGAGF
jgi:hypothetical protein